MEIKDIIKTKREELGLTYEQLGNMVGVGKSTVRKWETGMIENMRRDSIIALSNALDISPLVLMGNVFDNKENKSNAINISERKLLNSFNKLNDIGKDEAIKRVEELTYVSKYISTSIDTIAAHNDYTEDTNELMYIAEDIEDMKKW